MRASDGPGQEEKTGRWSRPKLDFRRSELPKSSSKSCATMSSHTCYHDRTSRSFHFPFWAVYSLSVQNPTGVFPRRSVTPTLEKDIPLVASVGCQQCFLSIQRPSGVESPSTRVRRPGPPGPTWPGLLGPRRARGVDRARSGPGVAAASLGPQRPKTVLGDSESESDFSST